MDDFFCFTNISDMLGKKRVALRERERERSPLIPFVCALQHFQMSVSLEQSRSKQLFEGRLGVTPDQTFKEVIHFAESSKSYIHKACF